MQYKTPLHSLLGGFKPKPYQVADQNGQFHDTNIIMSQVCYKCFRKYFFALLSIKERFDNFLKVVKYDHVILDISVNQVLQVFLSAA